MISSGQVYFCINHPKSRAGWFSFSKTRTSQWRLCTKCYCKLSDRLKALHVMNV